MSFLPEICVHESPGLNALAMVFPLVWVFLMLWLIWLSVNTFRPRAPLEALPAFSKRLLRGVSYSLALLVCCGLLWTKSAPIIERSECGVFHSIGHDLSPPVSHLFADSPITAFLMLAAAAFVLQGIARIMWIRRLGLREMEPRATSHWFRQLYRRSTTSLAVLLVLSAAMFTGDVITDVGDGDRGNFHFPVGQSSFSSWFQQPNISTPNVQGVWGDGGEPSIILMDGAMHLLPFVLSCLIAFAFRPRQPNESPDQVSRRIKRGVYITPLLFACGIVLWLTAQHVVWRVFNHNSGIGWVALYSLLTAFFIVHGYSRSQRLQGFLQRGEDPGFESPRFIRNYKRLANALVLCFAFIATPFTLITLAEVIVNPRVVLDDVFLIKPLLQVEVISFTCETENDSTVATVVLLNKGAPIYGGKVAVDIGLDSVIEGPREPVDWADGSTPVIAIRSTLKGDPQECSIVSIRDGEGSDVAWTK